MRTHVIQWLHWMTLAVWTGLMKVFLMVRPAPALAGSSASKAEWTP